MTSSLRIELETVTPLYLGGADARPEIRIPSMRGLLRFWYRAMDPEFRKYEDLIFGSGGGSGAGVLLMRNGDSQPRAPHYDISASRTTSAGLRYLGYPFFLKGGARKAIAPGCRFGVVHTLRPTPDEKLTERTRRAVVSGWWAICNLGGMGTRSRRGFGSITGTEVDTSWPEAKVLMLDARLSDIDQWCKTMQTFGQNIRKWFGSVTDAEHTSFKKNTVIVVLTHNKDPNGFRTWESALGYLGDKYKDFRDGKSLAERAGLGLPISGTMGADVSVQGTCHDRSASPLMMNIIRVKGLYYPVVTLFSSRILAPNERVRIVVDGKPDVVDRPQTDILLAFYEYVKDDVLWGVKL